MMQWLYGKQYMTMMFSHQTETESALVLSVSSLQRAFPFGRLGEGEKEEWGPE